MFSGGAVFLDGAGGRNVIGGNAVAEHREDARVVDLFDRRRLNLHTLEIRSAADVGGIFFPGVGLAFGDVEAAPALVAGKNLGVAFREHLGGDGFFDGFFDFALRGPDVGEVNRLAVFTFADGIFAKIGVDASG